MDDPMEYVDKVVNEEYQLARAAGKPLHVRVAEALGWTQIGPGNTMNMGDPGIGYPPTTPIVGHKEPIPRYDTDWSATGPLIERMFIRVFPSDAGMDAHSELGWRAAHGGWASGMWGKTPLIAVCNLILALHAAGKLEATSPAYTSGVARP